MKAFCEDYLPDQTLKLLFDLKDKPTWFDDLLKEHTVTWCRCLSHKLKNIAESVKMVFFFKSYRTYKNIEKNEVPLFQKTIDFVKSMKTNTDKLEGKLMLKQSCTDTGMIFHVIISNIIEVSNIGKSIQNPKPGCGNGRPKTFLTPGIF